MTEAACLLLSGGIESAYLLYRISAGHQRLHALYVRCGYRWEDAEESAVRALCQLTQTPLTVVRTNLAEAHPGHWAVLGNVPDAESPDSAVELPGRNLALIAMAGVLCAAHDLTEIFLGTLSSNPFDDATPQFFQAAEQLLQLSLGRPVAVRTPLASRKKFEILSESNGLPLELTFSCIDPASEDHWHCGRCNKCEERRRAFAKIGRVDPTRYAQ